MEDITASQCGTWDAKESRGIPEAQGLFPWLQSRVLLDHVLKTLWSSFLSGPQITAHAPLIETDDLRHISSTDDSLIPNSPTFWHYRSKAICGQTELASYKPLHPEISNDANHAHMYTPRKDFVLLGCLLYRITIGDLVVPGLGPQPCSQCCGLFILKGQLGCCARHADALAPE
eukprot:5825382-Amphidinium_carterae.1